MTLSRTLVFLVLVSAYGLLLLSLTTAARFGTPAVVLSHDAMVAAADPVVPPAIGHRTVEVERLESHLSDAGHFDREEDGAVVVRLMRDLLASYLPTGD